MDDGWYRGLIQEIKPNCALVKFLDYGNVEEVTFNRMAQLKPPLRKTKVQAIVCGFSQVKLCDGQVSSVQPILFYCKKCYMELDNLENPVDQKNDCGISGLG